MLDIGWCLVLVCILFQHGDWVVNFLILELNSTLKYVSEKAESEWGWTCSAMQSLESYFISTAQFDGLI